MSRSIANGIRVRLTPQEEVRLASAHPVNPEAYQSYLRGLYFWNKLTPDSAKLASIIFKQRLKKIQDMPLPMRVWLTVTAWGVCS